MLFEDEKRDQLKIKAKPGIKALANKLYKAAYPFASEANLDDLFEEMVTKFAFYFELIAADKMPLEQRLTLIDRPEEHEIQPVQRQEEVLLAPEDVPQINDQEQTEEEKDATVVSEILGG